MDVHTPADPALQGRALAIRIKQGTTVDITIVNMYFPPVQLHPNKEKITNKLYAWAEKLLDQLPVRNTPIICTDANGRMGQEAHNRYPDSIGAENGDEPTHRAGMRFAEFLAQNNMMAINTFVGIGPTFYSISSSGQSRVNYICIPTGGISKSSTAVLPSGPGGSFSSPRQGPKQTIIRCG